MAKENKIKKSNAGRPKCYNCDTKQFAFNLPTNRHSDAIRLMKELRKLSMINRPTIDFKVINEIFNKL